MRPDKLFHFQEKLRRERDKLRRQLELLEIEHDDESYKESIAEMSSYDQHPADAGTETFERGQDHALLERNRDRMAAIEDALRRIEEGTYGYCLRCGRPIEADRLEVIPETAYCYSCRHDMEAEDAYPSTGRPLEEEVLRPPWGLHSNPDHAGTDVDADQLVGYDGEDTWQELEAYGPARSPVRIDDEEDEDDSAGIPASQNTGEILASIDEEISRAKMHTDRPWGSPDEGGD